MSITLDEARKLCDAGVAKSQELGYLIGIAVLDSALEIKAFRRMDGAGAHNFDLAYRMAYTAGLFNGPERRCRACRAGDGSML